MVIYLISGYIIKSILKKGKTMKNNNKRLILVVIIVILAILAAYFIKNKDKLEAEKPGLSEDVEKPVEENEEEKEDDKTSENKPEEEAGKADLLGLNLTSIEEFNEIQKLNKPIIVEFGTKNCIYCTKMQPIMEDLNAKYKDKAIVKYVSLDEFPEFVSSYPIKGTPAMLYIDGEGNAYEPSEKYQPMMYAYSEQGKDNHILTMSYGYMDMKTLDGIIEEMLND